MQLLHDAICAIRDAKLPDVKQIGNAGSFFKNPVIERAQFEALQKEYPTMPHYDEPNGKVKVPADWLIEHSGPSMLRFCAATSGSGTSGTASWKGWRNEHVGVYEIRRSSWCITVAGLAKTSWNWRTENKIPWRKSLGSGLVLK